MHPLDSSLDTSVHNSHIHHHLHLHNRNHHHIQRRPRRTSLDNGATTAELIMLVSSSNKSIASIVGITNSSGGTGGCGSPSNLLLEGTHMINESNNVMLSTGQWYNYNSDDDYEESDYFATSSLAYRYSMKGNRRGPRRLSLNNCTAMNMTFLANMTNYNVSTADKSDLDIDCHKYENNTNSSLNKPGADTISVGTRSSYQSNTSATGFDSSSHIIKSINTISDDEQNGHRSNNDDIDVDDDDDDDMDSFCDAEGAEPADEEYMRKDLGASCIWNDEIANMGVIQPPVRRGGKKQIRTTTNSSSSDNNTNKNRMEHTTKNHMDENIDTSNMITNNSNSSNPIPADSATTSSSYNNNNSNKPNKHNTEFTVVNIHYDDNRSVDDHEDFFKDDDDDDEMMNQYYDETELGMNNDSVDENNDNDNGTNSALGTVVVVDYDHNTFTPTNTKTYDDSNDEMGEYEDTDDDGLNDDDDDEDDCDSFCDAKDDENADKEYMKKVLGASWYWNNSFDNLDDIDIESTDGTIPTSTKKKKNTSSSTSNKQGEVVE